MVERRRPLENDDGQEALFDSSALAPSRPSRPWEQRRVPGEDARDAAPASPVEPELFGRSDAPPADAELLAGAEAPPAEAPALDEVFAGEELAALEQAEVAVDDLRAARTPRAPLAGPTLDDVVSRVWEGLVTRLPAACPVCHGEVVPSAHGSLHGRCTACGTTIE